MESLTKRLTAKNIAVMGLLLAGQIILTNFLSYQVLTLRISFTFIATYLLATWFGPLLGGIGSVLSDLVGTVLFSKGGTFFWGFTFSAFLSAFFYGLVFYKKPFTLTRVIVAVLINVIVIDLLLNTFWLVLMYQSPWTIIYARGIKDLFLIPIQVTLLYIVGNNTQIKRLGKRL